MIMTVPDSWKGQARRIGTLSTRWTSCLSCLIFLVIAAPGSNVSPSQSDDRAPRAIDFLPGAADFKDWAPSGQAEVYSGEALYEYIDGGAEIYREYGFREVAVQDYKNQADRTATLEIYVMSSPAAAYGVYAFKTTGEGRPTVWKGVEGEVEAYYLNVWRGAVVATVTGLDESQETLAGVMAVGKAAAARLTGSLEKPTLVEALPRRGLKAGSRKYFRGRLGLLNVRSLFPGAKFPFAEGVRGLYNDGSELFIFATGSAREAGAAFEMLREAAQADMTRLGIYKEDEDFVFEDGKPGLWPGIAGRFVFAIWSVSEARAAELENRAASALRGR
jgi:Family of unknown function (DUF6599)